MDKQNSLRALGKQQQKEQKESIAQLHNNAQCQLQDIDLQIDKIEQIKRIEKVEKVMTVENHKEEIGGPKEEPVRYKDWTLKGKAVDF